MSAAQFAAPFEERRQPALVRAIVLSLGMHLLLLGMLLLGVNWQSREPEPVVVELYRAPPAPAPAPVIEPPAPAPAPAPIEPRVAKPDIALKEPPKKEAPKPKPVPKVEPKPPPKPAAPVRDLEFERRLDEQLAREQASLSSQRQEEEIRQLLARQQADAARREVDARSKALARWTDRIRAKIRGNIPILPPDLSGNPEAIFDVVLLPSGDVLSAKLRKSSGHHGYDEMVERAILKSSPLPKPDEARLFQRQLELKFRPQDK